MSSDFLYRKKKYLSAHKSFENLELHNNLFNWRESKLRIWEYIRFSCYIKYRAVLGLNDEINDHKYLDISFLQFIKIIINYFCSFVLFFIPKKSPIIVFGVSRRSKKNDVWIDQHTDYLIKYLPKNTLFIEENFNHKHYHPQPKARRITWDFVTYSSTILSRLFSQFLVLSKKGKKNIIKINKLIHTFDEKLLKYVILYSKISTFLTRIFIKVKGVKVCILVPAYGKESLIEAFKSENIKVIELQHGSITPKHYGYAYPSKFPKKNAPDILFSYGSYWKKTIEKYMHSTEIIILGSYDFSKKITNLKTILNYSSKKNYLKRVLIISQSRNSNFFKSILNTISKNIIEDIQIVYRPHPRENKLVSDNSFYSSIDNIYDDINSSEIIIGAYSTALYEALAMGKKVIVLDVEGATNFKSLQEYKNLFIAKDKSSLLKIIEDILVFNKDIKNNKHKYNGSYIYAKFDESRLLNVIENLT